MKIIHKISALRQEVADYKRAGKIIAFVPTMGNLHQGHLQLVKMAQSEADIVICSIFVNPLQFGEGEDFGQYPRTLEADAEKLKKAACDIVFAPSTDAMYPQSAADGRNQTQLIVPGISEILEGASRPGHFAGVATIVAKLFNIVQPDKAVFGEKDYQQLQVIKQLVKALCFPVEILSHAIVREASGLAMSSRNGFLSKEQKKQAADIYKILQSTEQQIAGGIRNYTLLQQNAAELLNQQGFVVDYIQIRAADLSAPTEQTKNLVILAAAYLGSTRLIDNWQISL